MNFTVLPEAELEAAEAVIWYDDQRIGPTRFADWLSQSIRKP